MATATLAHGHDPSLVALHLGRDAVWITREADYLFDLPGVDQSALNAAIAAAIAGTPPAAAVPQQVYGHQMRAVLRATPHGEGSLWDAVIALASQLPEPQRTTVDDSLRTAAVMRRDSPTIAAFQAALSLTPEYVDGLFVAAAGVRV